MSEASGSVVQETLEPHHLVEGEMATAAVGQGMGRSFLPLKRKPLTYSEDELSEYHHSKRFLSEEQVAAHLQHLKLSSEGGSWSVASTTPHLPLTSSDGGNMPPCLRLPLTPSEGGNTSPYPRHLNIKTVASCPQSIDSQVSRKRYLPESECCLDEDMIEMETSTLPARKRTRTLGAGEMHISNCINFKSDSRGVMHPSVKLDHQHESASSLHAVGSLSDLSSIPEEGEVTQQTSTLVSTTNTSIDTEAASDSDIDTADESNSEDRLISQAIPTSLPSSQSLLKSAELGDKVCSVWLAPELKAIKTHADSPLPLSILNKIGNSRSRGMEIVPWVSGVHTLLREGHHNDERKMSKESNRDALAAPGDAVKDSMMEMN